MPYVCEGTTIRTAANREGHVISVDRTNKVVVVRNKNGFFTEKLGNITVISYNGVM